MINEDLLSKYNFDRSLIFRCVLVGNNIIIINAYPIDINETRNGSKNVKLFFDKNVKTKDLLDINEFKGLPCNDAIVFFGRFNAIISSYKNFIDIRRLLKNDWYFDTLDPLDDTIKDRGFWASQSIVSGPEFNYHGLKRFLELIFSQLDISYELKRQRLELTFSKSKFNSYLDDAKLNGVFKLEFNFRELFNIYNIKSHINLLPKFKFENVPQQYVDAYYGTFGIGASYVLDPPIIHFNSDNIFSPIHDYTIGKENFDNKKFFLINVDGSSVKGIYDNLSEGGRGFSSRAFSYVEPLIPINCRGWFAANYRDIILKDYMFVYLLISVFNINTLNTSKFITYIEQNSNQSVILDNTRKIFYFKYTDDLDKVITKYLSESSFLYYRDIRDIPNLAKNYFNSMFNNCFSDIKIANVRDAGIFGHFQPERYELFKADLSSITRSVLNYLKNNILNNLLMDNLVYIFRNQLNNFLSLIQIMIIDNEIDNYYTWDIVGFDKISSKALEVCESILNIYEKLNYIKDNNNKELFLILIFIVVVINTIDTYNYINIGDLYFNNLNFDILFTNAKFVDKLTSLTDLEISTVNLLVYINNISKYLINPYS